LDALRDPGEYLRLIAFDHHEAGTALLEDLLRHGPLGEGRIHGERLTLEQQGLQEVAHAAEFARIIDDAHLSQHQAVAMATRGQQMSVGGTQSACSAEGLAVQGDAIHPAFGAAPPRRADLLQPGPEQRLKLVDVHITQQPMQCRLAGAV
jgi:hypothetical protein